MSSEPLRIPDPGLVVLVGAAGSGKSSFVARHFAPAEILSSDRFRELVAGDASDQSATPAAFSLLGQALDERMRRRRLTVVDATSLTRRERRRLLGVATKHDVSAVAIVLDLPVELCRRRAATRIDRTVAAEIVDRQHATLHRHLEGLQAEGFDRVTVLRSPAEVDAARVQRVPATPGQGDPEPPDRA